VQRQTESDEIEISIHPSPEISELASENGDEATEQELDEGMEAEPEPKEEQVVMDSNQSQMSRSQKRRRHRR
jgi:hypothetical protein